jgi:hypothetical protein
MGGWRRLCLDLVEGERKALLGLVVGDVTRFGGGFDSMQVLVDVAEAPRHR